MWRHQQTAAGRRGRIEEENPGRGHHPGHPDEGCERAQDRQGFRRSGRRALSGFGGAQRERDWHRRGHPRLDAESKNRRKCVEAVRAGRRAIARECSQGHRSGTPLRS